MFGLSNAIGKRGLYFGAGVKCAEHSEIKLPAGRSCRLQLLANEQSQPEIKRLPRHGLLDDLAVSLNLVTNGGTDEIGSVGVKTFFDQEINLAKINVSEIDCYLL